ncbi:NAD(P)-dependent dehydrogenase (short-subunit alcohol dehydrogenase family) [Williamsia limnetica]|uniref:NAD(P)-dependent dehydrogenase (Short-subunit alcohol dehydrogenase family) n=1 Tax=Williamsia limnetica TaxID=882452 RepID=A0A318RLF3_WILLI|nr:SDR family NAD(P)-dependent oxidoreductase [Williamsia limnetica]PYE15103.1 NAD(P)-dependent dehydrogenase (short-subunit alcohol dehydrogenase family) [Williamsia limnetica]
MSVSGSVALVTGASRGVGKGVATALGAAGWTVYVTARGGTGPDDPLGQTISEIDAAGGTAVGVSLDHSDDNSVATLFGQIRAEQGRLDLLVNNVWASPKGFGGFSDKFWERPVSDWDTLITVGVRAHYVACVEAAKIMVPQGSGLMVNISSFGTRGHLHSVLYGMSKAALDKMAFDMAHELEGTGVAAISLWLGLIQTELLLSLGIEEFAGFRLDEAEHPQFVGRVIDRLWRDPSLLESNGHSLVTAELGASYGLTNNDGGLPKSHREPFGGGPLFPPA